MYYASIAYASISIILDFYSLLNEKKKDICVITGYQNEKPHLKRQTVN